MRTAEATTDNPSAMQAMTNGSPIACVLPIEVVPGWHAVRTRIVPVAPRNRRPPSLIINRGQVTFRHGVLLTSKKASGNVLFPIFLRYSCPPEYSMSEQVKKPAIGERAENLHRSVDLQKKGGQ